MKTLPSELVNCGTLVFGVRIVRRDGTVLGWTQHDVDQVVDVDGDETLLLAAQGLSVQQLVNSAGLDVDTSEISIAEVGDELGRGDILARKWDGAKVRFFRYSWKAPLAGIIDASIGSFGNFKPLLGEFRVEFRDLRQALQSNSTWRVQETCRNRLGDARCRKDLTSFTFTAVPVTAVASQTQFTASSLAQASDFFGEGELTWLTGANEGTPSVKVKAFAAGVVTLSEAMVYPISTSDTFEIVAGCRKRWDVDCKAKFDNLLNFNGEKDKGTREDLVAVPEESEA